jgi:hypothetical protein
MTRKLTSSEVPLDKEVQEAILALTLVDRSGETTTLGRLVTEALRNLQEANDFLRASPLIQITAENLMQKEKRRGTPTLCISGEGEVLLRIAWGDVSPEGPPANPEKLPTLDELREQARSLGVDISDLGRQKLNILQRLREFSQGEQLPVASK